MNQPPPAAAAPPPPISLPLQTKPPLPSALPTSQPSKTLAGSSQAACVPIPLPPPVKLTGKILSNKGAMTAAPGSKNCESCGSSHDGSYGSGRFCSSNCAKKVGANIKWSQVVGGTTNTSNSSAEAMLSSPKNSRRSSSITKKDGSPFGLSPTCRKRRKQEDKRCENCGVTHDGSYGSGRFCSVHCARRVAASRKWEKQRSDKSKVVAGLVKRRRMTPSPPPPAVSMAAEDSALKRSISAPAGGGFVSNGVELGAIGGYMDLGRMGAFAQSLQQFPQRSIEGNRPVTMHTAAHPQYWVVPAPQYPIPSAAQAANFASGVSHGATPQPPHLWYAVPPNAALAPGAYPQMSHIPQTLSGAVHPPLYHGPYPTPMAMPQLMRYPSQISPAVATQHMQALGAPPTMVPIATRPSTTAETSRSAAQPTADAQPGPYSASQKEEKKAGRPQLMKREVKKEVKEEAKEIDAMRVDESTVRQDKDAEEMSRGNTANDNNQATKDSSCAAHVLLSFRSS